MVPKTFQDLVSRVNNAEIPPIKERLEELKVRVSTVEGSLKRQLNVQQMCQYLVNGETMGGGMGHTPTISMFVRQYKTEERSVYGRTRVELCEVDMVIVPALLVEHELDVQVPYPDDPHRLLATTAQLSVEDIVKRMLEYTKHAKNVSVGTFTDVLCEACAKCGRQAPVATFDVHDQDNGREFTVKRICGACSQVDLLAYYPGRYEKDPQYCLTDCIYRQ